MTTRKDIADLRWQLEVTYPLELGEIAKHDKEIERAVGVRAHSTGGGFGGRDMQFAFKTKDEATRAAERAQKVMALKFEIWEHLAEDD